MEEQNIRSGTITALDAQARHADRVNLAIDGEFALGLSGVIVLEQGLYVGQELTEADLLHLRSLEEVAKATESALRLVAHRVRTEVELRRRLVRNGFSPEAITATIERMHEWHYLDDEDFARRFVESREGHRPRSASMIRRELVGKGVDVEMAGQVVDEAEIDDQAIARELARKWLSQHTRDAEEVRRRKLIGFLQRRGFGWDVIRHVLDEPSEDAE
jgi:regulatory protein